MQSLVRNLPSKNNILVPLVKNCAKTEIKASWFCPTCTVANSSTIKRYQNRIERYQKLFAVFWWKIAPRNAMGKSLRVTSEWEDEKALVYIWKIKWFK